MNKKNNKTPVRFVVINALIEHSIVSFIIVAAYFFSICLDKVLFNPEPMFVEFRNNFFMVGFVILNLIVIFNTVYYLKNGFDG